MSQHLLVGDEGEGPYLTREEWRTFLAALQTWRPNVSPANAQYFVGAADSTLTNERVAVNSPTVLVDTSVAGQVKWLANQAAFGAGYMFGLAGGDDGGSDGPPGPAGANGATGQAGAGLLARTAYNPAVATSTSTASATPADIDATNLKITFIGPPSGAVVVRLDAVVVVNNASAVYVWNLHDGSANVTNSFKTVTANTNMNRAAVDIVLTGLTPGASVTYTWRHAVSSNNGSTRYGDDGTSSGKYGQAVMEVWDAAPGQPIPNGTVTQRATADTNVAGAATITDVTGASITLSPGTWLLWGTTVNLL